MPKFVIGQRWISEMEPELGIGTVKEIEKRRVHILFPAGQCERIYAIETAPIKRVRFNVGDKVKNNNNQKFIVKEVIEKDGLLIYYGDDHKLFESDLSDSLSFTSPKDRLLQGQVDSNKIFNLRYETLQIQHKMRKSEIRGFIGGRIELIPHQLYIAHEIACEIS